MIRLKESILVERSLGYVYRYTSDFSHIQDWDPGVISSFRVDQKKIGVGSRYDLVLKFGPFRPKMRYEIVEYAPLSRVVLNGVGESFTAMDTIVFTKTVTGTQIDYQADIRFHRFGNVIEKILSPIMKKTGENAMAGLKHKLSRTQDLPNKTMWFKSGAGLPDYLADHLIVPGMILFSRFGYALGRRFWSEPKGVLYGKKIVLTGGTSGIGKAAAFKLAEKKAFLTIIARNRIKAEQVQQEIVKKTGNPHIDFLIADLSLMQDIREVSETLKASKKNIDVLINNAGALFNERKNTPEGLEQTFATDLLGVFLLTQYLKDALAASKSPRIINVSSGGMYTQKIEVNDLENSQGQYNGAKAYARAKRGVVILTQIWAEQFKKYGIRVNAMHPGWVDTPGIERSLPEFHQLVKRILRTPEQGADTIVWLASSKRAGQYTGLFWLDRRPHETVIFPGTCESAQERQILWEKLNAFLSKG
ncbi:dehydrogenase [Desulfobacter hydrogenophilus]|uniref:Dehydrogenase n=1 Tax=Desulfobacter hydrogenophilus TaxID=2291 RepID=A0A328F882_9BACT|nr:SDR family NAD(P)-dependent oxidoreductase [Desulfobacter hydrogenophilus]NDY72555.1 SDR family NAD(P)-dependent oxidoreductase [Desulfobacter hydrogenophilus]QBH13279.1 SDR family NAD(P)-dependent oxidoreductase [Desulfobacter hydrogenophilus]RAL99859.1 dehydrogenase [Desulfobacter hydrogenophilus]